MSVTADHRPQMSVEEFEELAAHAPETVTLEFINGKIGVKPVPDGDHGTIIMWLLRRCMQARPELDLHVEQGLRVDRYRSGHARPDGVLAPIAHFAGQGEWANPSGTLMIAEVTSYDCDTDRRDRVEKPVAYAEAGIPVYVLIDRDTCETVVHSEPEDGKYRAVRSHPFGATFEIADLGITLETEILKQYVR
ncbi:Uma2 family endonuclease [Streptomyces sp. MJP52]|uniref:Uma2 family endonuclease n=1 Tax=Streptomyces sp. MJP52 TaxID=2940555 RepID=UPI0024757E90|nr:Uma2 family endonuclease [Streptomyces sp. MJP52]MDH6225893.1 Uma2 family endonuclease [Streptomyces sp. MJP52]